MKNLFLILIIPICISFQNPVFCAQPITNQQNAEISKIENNLFGFDYNKDTVTKRLERLEMSVYGKTQSGNLTNRIKKLATDMTAEQIGLELPPNEDTFRMEEEVADSTVDYPILNEIEQKLFNQTYKNRDFHTRIVTIEKRLFKTVYDAEDYSSRMDRIKKEIMPETTLADKSNDSPLRDYYDTNFSSEDFKSNKKSWFNFGNFGQKNYTRPYANYGEGLNEFNHSKISDDIAQMEYDTFGTEFSSDDTKTRLKRLKSANKAKKSSGKYDSQRFQQHMATAMEIGAMILMILAMVL